MENSSQNIFEESGLYDPIIATQVLGIIGMGQDDFVIPGNVEKFKNIARFVRSAPDALALLDRAVVKAAYRPGDSKVDAAIRYIDLRTRYQEMQKGLEELKRDISFYE